MAEQGTDAKTDDIEPPGMMSITCKNCGRAFDGKFCNDCGQPADTHRLSMHFIWHDLQHGLFHFDHGIFYTVGQLLRRPGHSIREFIEGKRVRHFKPLSLVVVLATLDGLLYHYAFHRLFRVEKIGGESLTASAFKLFQWIADHYAYSSLILVANTTLVSYFIFRKQGYNFAEHLVLNTFYIGLVLIFTLVTLPILYVSKEPLLNWYPVFTQILELLLMYWCYVQFFNQLTKTKTLLLVVVTHLIRNLLNFLTLMLLGWIVSGL